MEMFNFILHNLYLQHLLLFIQDIDIMKLYYLFINILLNYFYNKVYFFNKYVHVHLNINPPYILQTDLQILINI